jgi:abl interactor 2
VSSTKNAYLSIRHGTANKSTTPPSVASPVPAALPRIANNFGPPPIRRVSSNVASPASETKSPPPPPPRPAQKEPEPEGDWAEALYEYSSEVRVGANPSLNGFYTVDRVTQDPGDLELQEGQRVLVLERTSDDWCVSLYCLTRIASYHVSVRWTAEYQGKRGLVPASYVQVL